MSRPFPLIPAPSVSTKLDGLVKSPSAALRVNFVVAEGRGGSPSRPISDLRALHVGASCRSPIMGVRPDAPTIETILLLTFYEFIKLQ